jgi:translation initiation factor 1
MSSSRKSSSKNKIVYQEFEQSDRSTAPEKSISELPPPQQNLRIQASRAGRKGKTVTIITGFQSSPDTLAKLLKQLKTKCGSGGTLKDNSIEIQGDRRQQLLPILTELGYKAKISGG